MSALPPKADMLRVVSEAAMVSHGSLAMCAILPGIAQILLKVTRFAEEGQNPVRTQEGKEARRPLTQFA